MGAAASSPSPPSSNGLGLTLSDAVPGSLIVIGLASLVAVLPRARDEVNWRLAATIGAAGIPTSLAG